MASRGGSDLVHAETYYTFDDDGEITNAETLVIAGKTYTFQDTLTNTDGNVHIGATREETIRNLCAAVNLDGTATAGTDYAAATTKNARVVAIPGDDEIVIRAHVPGTAGNLIPVTVGTSGVTVDNATLENGAGDVGDFINSVIELNQINSEVLSELKRLTPLPD